MIIELCTSPVKTIVLGDLSGGLDKDRLAIISIIKRLIASRSVIIEEEEGPLLLKRSDYDCKNNCYIVNPEFIKLRIWTFKVGNKTTAMVIIKGDFKK